MISCFASPAEGPVAQLGARVNGIHEVAGSIPAWSTNPDSRPQNYALAFEITTKRPRL